jgi:hypothetical protein
LQAALEGLLIDELDLDVAMVLLLKFGKGVAVDGRLLGDEGCEDEIGFVVARGARKGYPNG